MIRSLAPGLVAWALIAWLPATQAQSLQPIPKLEARVTDRTGTLTAEQQTTLEQKLAAFEARKGAQVAVLIVPTTQPEEIEQYGIRVVDEWKLGRKEVGGKRVDDGALLLIAKNDRRLRIEVGYGLEGALTDATSERIISETITPRLREGDFFGGINAGLDQMMRVIDGEPLPPPQQGWQGRGAPDGHNVLGLLILVLVASIALRTFFGRALGSVLTGVGAGIVVWLAGYAVFLALLAGLGALLFTAFSNSPIGRGWSSYPRSGGWGGGWGGLGGGGFGGGVGGGGGGFSGGGGGFGGGGASGRW